MDAINSLGKNITMILDAHHLNTLKKYDIVYKFNKGYFLGHYSSYEIIKNRIDFFKKG
jgi:ABC-type bacteriocin/lantibiotic exporter with double-glycine peptidase domain